MVYIFDTTPPLSIIIDFIKLYQTQLKYEIGKDECISFWYIKMLKHFFEAPCNKPDVPTHSNKSYSKSSSGSSTSIKKHTCISSTKDDSSSDTTSTTCTPITEPGLTSWNKKASNLNCNFHEACKHERNNISHTPKIFDTINSITSHRGVDMGVESHLQTATQKIQAATPKDRTIVPTFEWNCE